MVIATAVKESGGASGGAGGVSSISNGCSESNQVPSITLSIAQDDVRRVLEASKALKQQLQEIRADPKPVIKDEVRQQTRTTRSTAAAAISSNEMDDGGDLDPPLRTVSAEDDETDTPKTCGGVGGEGSGIGVETETAGDTKRPMHELIFEAARQCDNSMLQSFLEKMKHSGSSPREIRAGVLVFSDMDLNSKIQHIFALLEESNGGGSSTASLSEVEARDKENASNCSSDEVREPCLTRNGALSLFRAVIVAISSCIHKNERFQIEMEKVEEPAAKRIKRNPRETSGKGDDSIPSIAQTAATSFDSTVATLKDEEEDDFAVSAVRKEFEDIASYATERLVKHAKKKLGKKGDDNVSVTFSIFQDWRRAEGAKIAPWLALLDLARWKTPQRSTERSSAPLQPSQQLKASSPVPPPTTTNAGPAPPKIKEEPIEQNQQQPQQVSQPDLATTEQKPVPVPDLTAAASNDNKACDITQAEHSTSQADQTPVFVNATTSRTVLSFDFSGSVPEGGAENSYAITITEENLITYRNLVRSTGLMNRTFTYVTRILMDASVTRAHEGAERHVLPFERYHTCLHQFFGAASRPISKIDREVFSSCFVDFFSCFNTGEPPLEKGEADASLLAVGFSFVCSGNKSSKLAGGFDMLEQEKGTGLTNQQLVFFLQSYLAMLVGISLLTSSPDGLMKPKLDVATRKVMLKAVENGARWTLGHFLQSLGLKDENSAQTRHTFETFATWYSDGGYSIAPWLELLDLKKLLALVSDDDDINIQSPAVSLDALAPFPGPKIATPNPYLSPRRIVHHGPPPSHQLPLHQAQGTLHHAAAPPVHGSSSKYGGMNTPGPFSHPHPPPPSEILFTFPLANNCSLVVLKEDASYVRGVVDQLGLLAFSPDDIWSTLFNAALKKPPIPFLKGTKKPPKNSELHKGMEVDKASFVECMQETIKRKGGSKAGKKRSASGASKTIASSQDVLTNFFQSFDLMQVDRVALNELMGGLTLLCGGKKSTKLAFAFSVFDKRPSGKKKPKKGQTNANSLDGEELFLFLRSFLIVMFSCCRQSWSLSDDSVNRYIADTANMVTDDMMRYQWQKRKKIRVDFDEFGQWYNEGGFETAPWLELLDLKKWVLMDDFCSLEKDLEKQLPPPMSPGFGLANIALDPDCPPPPPDADMDLSFLDDDGPAIKTMDSMDEMDLLLLQQPSSDKDEAMFSKLTKSSYLYSPKMQFSPKPVSTRSPRRPPPPTQPSSSLKFHLVTDDSHSGFMVSVSQKRIAHLRHILVESGLYRIDGETACREIIATAARSSNYLIKKDDFDSAMRRVVSSKTMSLEAQQTLSSILNQIFFSFDDGTGKANAFDLACGFTVLCHGKKSDKLEYAFEILDQSKQGSLSVADTTRYLRSFLTVLLNVVSTEALHTDFVDDTMTTMNGEVCERSFMTLSKAVNMGCQWASAQVMTSTRGNENSISFDDFADWYTRVGYSKIPWLELLDLNKWVTTDSAASRS